MNNSTNVCNHGIVVISSYVSLSSNFVLVALFDALKALNAMKLRFLHKIFLGFRFTL